MAATCPLCSAPMTLPMPRISRSRIAILKPEPSSVAARMVLRRASASSVNDLFGWTSR